MTRTSVASAIDRCCDGVRALPNTSRSAPLASPSIAISRTLPRPIRNVGSGRDRRWTTTAATATPAVWHRAVSSAFSHSSSTVRSSTGTTMIAASRAFRPSPRPRFRRFAASRRSCVSRSRKVRSRRASIIVACRRGSTSQRRPAALSGSRCAASIIGTVPAIPQITATEASRDSIRSVSRSSPASPCPDRVAWIRRRPPRRPAPRRLRAHFGTGRCTASPTSTDWTLPRRSTRQPIRRPVSRAASCKATANQGSTKDSALARRSASRSICLRMAGRRPSRLPVALNRGLRDRIPSVCRAGRDG